MSITEFQSTDLVTRANVNEKIQQINSLFPVSIANGGTGATTAEEALTNIGAAASSHTHPASDITSGTLPIERGGTGATTSAQALKNLGVNVPTVLYENYSGSTGTITLSSPITNFNTLGVYAKNRGTDHSAAVYNEIRPGYTTVMSLAATTATNNNYDTTVWFCAVMNFSGTTLTFSKNFASSYDRTGGYNSNSSDGFKILRVVGYKY